MRVNILDEEDAMRIAHVDRRRAEQNRRVDRAHLDVENARVHALGERYLLPFEFGRAHVDRDAAVAFARAVEEAAFGPERHARLAGFAQYQARHTARAVAAGFDLVAVRVPDAHLGVGALLAFADD